MENTLRKEDGFLRLIFVRHGETVGPSSIRFYGSTDIPLNEEGREQMKSAGKYLEKENFSGVFTSPLMRTIEGAALILGNRKLIVNKIDGFREINFGRWEGLTIEEIKEKDPGLFPVWRKSLWNFNYPEGDRRDNFVKRVRNGMDNVLKLINNGTYLFVLHKGIIRTIFYYLLDRDENSFNFEADLGSIHELERIEGKWNLVRMNYIEHLKFI